MYNIAETFVDEVLEFVGGFVSLHVSDPYNKSAFTLVLKMQSLVCLESAVKFQMGRRVSKAWLCWCSY